MSSPDIVVLDTRGATDKDSFLAAAARDLGFPEYFGGNWDAFEECVRDFAAQRTPVLVVWTGAADVPQNVRETAIDIFSDAFPTGADVLIVDDVSSSSQPDFAVGEQRLQIPSGGLSASQEFWTTVGFHVLGNVCEADAISILLVEVDSFSAGLGPEIVTADVAELTSRLTAGGYQVTETALGLDVSDPHGNLITFTAY
jgi:RNAse (barnase) inhibitor barstar